MGQEDLDDFCITPSDNVSNISELNSKKQVLYEKVADFLASAVDKGTDVISHLPITSSYLPPFRPLVTPNQVEHQVDGTLTLSKGNAPESFNKIWGGR